MKTTFYRGVIAIWYSKMNSVLPFVKFSFLILMASMTCNSQAQNVNSECCNYVASIEAIKIQFFLETCSVPRETQRGMVPYFDCQSFVLGVVSAYRHVNFELPKLSQLCIPESLTTKNLLELIMKKYPNWGIKEERLASEVIIETLEINYLCK